jgi:heme ABC exporter ATP-binding subunit CcmA
MSAETMLPARLDRPTAHQTAPLAVEAVGLIRAFGPKLVLRGVDLRLERGATLALVGPNGAGKTTLLRVLATLARPDAGCARVWSYDIVRDAAALRQVVGYVGHQPHLYEELTAHENLAFFARMYGLAHAGDRARALLARVGLSGRANDRVRTLSRGQLQRLSLARGILHDPAVLLLDEPETGLDEAASALLEALLAERRASGQSTIMTTHQLERALELADAVAALARGRIVFTARADALDGASLRAAFHSSTGGDR